MTSPSYSCSTRSRAAHSPAPLRARREDIEPLTDFFVQRFARELGKSGLRVSDEARAMLAEGFEPDWPPRVDAELARLEEPPVRALQDLRDLVHHRVHRDEPDTPGMDLHVLVRFAHVDHHSRTRVQLLFRFSHRKPRERLVRVLGCHESPRPGI